MPWRNCVIALFTAPTRVASLRRDDGWQKNSYPCKAHTHRTATTPAGHRPDRAQFQRQNRKFTATFYNRCS